MAFLILFEHLAVVLWGSELRTLPAVFGNADWRIAGLVIGLPQLIGLIASLALIFRQAPIPAWTRLLLQSVKSIAIRCNPHFATSENFASCRSGWSFPV